MTPSQKRGGSLAIAGASLLTFVGNWEGSAPVAYADKLAYGIPTVCNGHTGPDVVVGEKWTKERCNAILVTDVETHGQRLLACITVAINQHEYDAYASWAYNIGTGAACGSTAIKLLNRGERRSACDQLLRWDRAGGRVVKGLTLRRKAERDLCVEPMPQITGKATA